MKEDSEKELHARKKRTSWFRFYEELNDFLPGNQQKVSFPYIFYGKPSVKNTVEAIGVPHTEIDVILIDGKSVGFDQLLSGGEHISVYPVFESFDIGSLSKLRETPLRIMKFILDVHLGKLAKLLRRYGFDSVYQNDYEDAQIIRIALKENRIILTRDLGILKNGAVTHGYFVRSQAPRDQLAEVFQRFQLQDLSKPLSRCIHCNGSIVRVPKETILNRLEPKTIKYYHEFFQCNDCCKVYWEGSHYWRMKTSLEKENPAS